MAKLLLIVLVISFSVPPFYFSKELTSFEIRYYITIFLFMIGIGVFAILRMYNATVANTRFLIALKNALMAWKVSLSKLDITISTTLSNAIDRLIRTIKSNTDQIDTNRKTDQSQSNTIK